jgi:hypothetical protein
MLGGQPYSKPKPLQGSRSYLNGQIQMNIKQHIKYSFIYFNFRRLVLVNQTHQ